MIYVVTHKIFKDQEICKEDKFKVLHVGKNNNCKQYYLRDDSGDNISERNPNFCELTGYYWVWKNGIEKPEEPVGIVHYRRCFSNNFNGACSLMFHKRFIPLSYKNILSTLRKKDIVLPVRHIFNESVEHQFSRCHDGSDLLIIRRILENIFPDYITCFDKVMAGICLHTGNMLITKKRNFDNYCNWLFRILFEFEKYTDMAKYETDYQKRIFGFLAERLLDVYVRKNRLSVREYPAINIEKYCRQ